MWECRYSIDYTNFSLTKYRTIHARLFISQVRATMHVRIKKKIANLYIYISSKMLFLNQTSANE